MRFLVGYKFCHGERQRTSFEEGYYDNLDINCTIYWRVIRDENHQITFKIRMDASQPLHEIKAEEGSH